MMSLKLMKMMTTNPYINLQIGHLIQECIKSVQWDHPIDNILGSIRKGVTTRSHLAHFCQFYSFVSSLEPLKVDEALKDLDWVMAMQEELNNFERNHVWELVERPKTNVIGTKWGLPKQAR